jgi:hypothetical protein
VRKFAATAVALAALAIAGCSAQTQSAQNVGKTSATLRATLKWNDGDGPGHYWFEYRFLKLSGDWNAWTHGQHQSFNRLGCSNEPCSGTYSENVTGLTADRLYQYRLCGYFNSNPNAIACYDQSGNSEGENSSSGGYSSLYTDTHFYSDSSPFNTPVPSSPTPVSNSQQTIDRITGQGYPAKNVAGNDGTSSDFSHPVYFASNSDPLYSIHQSDYPVNGFNGDIEGKAIHIPVGAQPAGGSDHSFAVVEPADAQGLVWEYDFWNADAPSGNGGTFSAAWGKRGLWSGGGLGTSQSPYRGGITAAGFSNELGVVRESEIESGTIDHALFISVNGWNDRVWPSADLSGTTGEVTDPNAPAMGARLWLDLTPTQINNLGLPSWETTLLQAMHKYGMYVGDNGGAPWSVQFESGFDYTSFGLPDPWIAYAQSQGISSSYDSTTGRTVYKFDFQHALDSVGGWDQHLEVLTPGQ